MTFGVTGAILTEAALSFLGLGDPSTVSWGMMLQWCFTSGYTFKAPFWLLPPGLCITFLALSFYLIGIGTEQIVNPRLRER
jgi:peptide/nickel transport system permease protein